MSIISNCNGCRNAFKCTRYTTCQRAAQARQIIFANRAELLFLTEPVAYYQVDRTQHPARVIKDFKKYAKSAIYSIEESERGGLHVNFIATDNKQMGELSHFASEIGSRSEARRVGAYIAKPDQIPDKTRLFELSGLKQQTNSWGNIRTFELICQSDEMTNLAPHIVTQAAIVAISNTLGITRSTLDKTEKNPLIASLKQLMIEAWRTMKTQNQNYFFIQSRGELVTLAQVESILKKIGMRKEL